MEASLSSIIETYKQKDGMLFVARKRFAVLFAGFGNFLQV